MCNVASLPGKHGSLEFSGNLAALEKIWGISQNSQKSGHFAHVE